MPSKSISMNDYYALHTRPGGFGYEIHNRHTQVIEYSGDQLGSCLYQMQAMTNVLTKAVEEGLCAPL